MSLGDYSVGRIRQGCCEGGRRNSVESGKGVAAFGHVGSENQPKVQVLKVRKIALGLD